MTPIPMLLNCPKCGAGHVDLGEWATKPHRTHLCSSCGLQWKPALVPTVGVVELGELSLAEPEAWRASLFRALATASGLMAVNVRLCDPEPDEFETIDEKARRLVAEGYQQTSGKYRMIARLSPGKTGIESLKAVSRNAYDDMERDIERSAAMMYRRCHASQRGDSLELTVEEFQAFKRAGGVSA